MRKGLPSEAQRGSGPGPVTLHVEDHQMRNGRYRGKLARGGKLGLVSPVTQASYQKNGGGNRIRTGG